MMTKSLSDLKPGDQVILCDYKKETVTIDRVTKTQIIIGSFRFNRKHGRQIGCNYWAGAWIQIATPELIAEIKTEKQIKKAKYRANALIEEFGKQYRYSDNLIAALPHLEKALNVLTSDQEAN